LVDPGREAVPDLFQLADRQHTRAAEPANREVDSRARKRRPEEPGEGELHRRDLAPEVGARRAIVVLVENAVKTLWGTWRDDLFEISAFEQQLGQWILLYEYMDSRRAGRFPPPRVLPRARYRARRARRSQPASPSWCPWRPRGPRPSGRR